jgi:hypothetical protein
VTRVHVPRQAATLSVNQLWSFVDTLEGALTIVIHTDPFWYNRLLLELDLDSDDVRWSLPQQPCSASGLGCLLSLASFGLR